MPFKNKLKKFKKIYLIIITSVLFLNTFLIEDLKADSFKISEIEVSEQFDLNFNKYKVFDEAFRVAFKQLISMITTSDNRPKLKTITTTKIKSLIDSFNIEDEKFIENKYYATFNVNFNKKKTLKFIEGYNTFPSTPKKIDIFFLSVLFETKKEKLMIYDENPIYNNWSEIFKPWHLLNYILPDQDIEDRLFLEKNIESLEDYDFKEIIKKYDLKNFIINIVYKDKNTLKVLSKIKLNNNYKILNNIYENVDFNDSKSLEKFILKIKNTYEDNWKELNIINTSIKNHLNIILLSNDDYKIKLFEKTLSKLDLVSKFFIISFDNKNIYYKVIYNGPPNKFLKEIKDNGFEINNNEDGYWKIQ
jgi:hypothetical protein